MKLAILNFFSGMEKNSRQSGWEVSIKIHILDLLKAFCTEKKSKYFVKITLVIIFSQAFRDKKDADSSSPFSFSKTNEKQMQKIFGQSLSNLLQWGLIQPTSFGGTCGWFNRWQSRCKCLISESVAALICLFTSLNVTGALKLLVALLTSSGSWPI